MDLPIDQLRFNLLLRALITVYSINGIGNFIAYIPWMSKEDAETLWYNGDWNHSFQLTSSLIFCLLWIAQFRYQTLVYLTIVEIIIVLITYLHLIECKLRYIKDKKVRFKKIIKKKAEEMKSKLC